MRTTIVSDKVLVANYLNGNRNALEELFTRHRERIYTTIYLLVKNRAIAEDIFQDTFVKVIRTLDRGKYREEGKFLPWASRIAHNLCIDFFRRGKKMKFVNPNIGDEERDLFSYLDLKEETVEDKMIRDQSHSKVRQLIQFLPEEQKEVLILRHYAGLSFKEIAEQTDVSINTALGRMRYALNNLRKLIEENQVEI